ncbi:ABC transporter permease subunit [Arenibaculum sp.]|jgi:oligopeptide transport system permease protein|uniref:ABC transporter permease subunit n=1 Tax=Arenibaculum sp. TaxID=2865862 RepID=UPI002E0ECB84|nr:ABC transporter permease subunit [Arenibaculum sp.]
MEVRSAVAGRSPGADAWRRLRRNRAALTAGAVLAAIAAACLLGPLLHPVPPGEVFWDAIQSPPDIAAGHPFGTDANGRDILARTLHGGRVSLAVGLAATLVSLVIGVAWGSVAGYAGGRVDAVMMRIVDVLYALPFMFFVILLMVFFGRNILLIFVAIGAVAWLDMARIVRGQTLSIKRLPYIEAARAGGLGSAAIIRRHVVPNALGPVVVYATLTVPKVILLESLLSFLGLGVREPATSWGVLIGDGVANMERAPWMLVFPAGFLAATLFCLNFLGDGLRDALDPRDP